MKLVLLTLVCLAVCVAGKFTEKEYEDMFTKWQQAHSKSFTADDFLARYTIFKGHVDSIHEHNSKNLSWTQGTNHLSHLSPAEFRSYYLTTITGANHQPTPTRYHEGEEHRRGMTVDWRTRGAVTPVRDQGQCGSCWTFATTATTEGAWFIKTGKLPYLSEQQIVDCDTNSGGCNGGNPSVGLDYIKKTGGQDTRTSYPYKAVRGTCVYNAANSGATVSGRVNVPSKNEASLASAVNVCPTSVAIDASHFQNYKSGIFNDPACSSTTLNHAVTAVGYGNDGQGDYWMIKNSWGTGWGMSGYFQLAKGVNRCGVSNDAVYATTTGTGNRV